MTARPDDILAQLVHQFSDPFAFYRELIQNSLDAGSTRVEVTVRFQPGEPGTGRGVAVATVQDWGEGMNREIIEKFLLTKFRSSKEDDLTKIGKFGIGFMSVFAPGPQLVAVDTGRDGEDFRLLLYPDRSYELLRCPEPVEGTRVVVHKEMTREQYAEFAERSGAAVRRWCRHSEADVAFAAADDDGSPPGPPAPVHEPLEVAAPVQVEYREEGTRIVAGPFTGDGSPPCGFYNRGLTLLETEEPLCPGVTFKIVSRYLEHTLTRDNVRRDRHFERAMKLVRRLAEGPLVERVRAELRVAAEGPVPVYPQLLAWARGRLDEEDLWFPRAGSGIVDGRAVRKAARREDAVLFAAAGDPLAAALEGSGRLVLLEGSWMDAAAAVAERQPRPASAAWSLAAVTEDAAARALAAALDPLLAAAGARRSAHVADVHGAAAAEPAVLSEAPGRPDPVDRIRRSPFARGGPAHLCLNRGHPRVQAALRVAERAPGIAALLCARLLAIHHGVLDEDADRRLTEAALAGGGPA